MKKKLDVETSLEAIGECGNISKFKFKIPKNKK